MKIVLFVACCLWGFVTIVQGANTVKDCEKKLGSLMKTKLCDIRKFKLIEDPEVYKHMDCVMKALEFVDSESHGDYHKLIKPLNAIVKDRKHDMNLETCIGNANKKPVGHRAHEFYKCMLKSTSGEEFKKVFDLTELIKSGKVPLTAKYSPSVEKIMKKIDEKICN